MTTSDVVKTLDKDITFLQEEVARLRRPPLEKERWAQSKAARFEEIIERLRGFRRQHQMATVGGRTLQDYD